MSILRGTTPDFVIKVSTDDFVVTDVTKLEVTIWNGQKQTIYGLADVTVDTTENTFGIHFTEADTLALDSSKTFRWQMRCSNGALVAQTSDTVTQKRNYRHHAYQLAIG